MCSRDQKFDDWTITNREDRETVFALSRSSLDEVKALTEHEDEKANRILTAMAFLSAFAGLLFQSWHSKVVGVDVTRACCYVPELIVFGYMFFFIYTIALIIGVLFTVYAVRPNFRSFSVSATGTSSPKSRLFFEKIIETDECAWRDEFMTSPENLQMNFIRDHVRESHVIAKKIPTKVVPLKIGVWCFLASIFTLIAWVIVAVSALLGL